MIASRTGAEDTSFSVVSAGDDAFVGGSGDRSLLRGEERVGLSQMHDTPRGVYLPSGAVL